MRIVAGQYRGRNLVKSDHLKSLRPTTDKNREALFSILSSGKFGFKLLDAEILDLCCGTGAVGFEALSRGAKSVLFVDNNSTHLEIAKKNCEMLNLTEQCQFLLCNVKNNLPEASKNFDLIFIDPPYAENYSEIIGRLKEKGWIKIQSLVVIELKSGQENQLQNLDFLQEIESRKYGSTTFIFCRTLISN